MNATGKKAATPVARIFDCLVLLSCSVYRVILDDHTHSGPSCIPPEMFWTSIVIATSAGAVVVVTLANHNDDAVIATRVPPKDFER